MEPLVHPSELSTWQRYLQARRINKESSRSKNPDWYKDPGKLDAQLHLFVEGETVVRASHRTVSGDGVTWTSVDPPSLQADEGAVEQYFSEYFAAHLKKKHRSVGIILHLADEFAISELAAFHETPQDLNELKQRLLLEPREILEDHSVSTENLSFRLLPYLANVDVPFAGVAITITKRHHELLRLFRRCGEQANFPIRTSARSAPLEALAALPTIFDSKPEKAACFLFAYQDFSVLAFFDKHGELALLRSVRHHSGGVPHNAHVIVQTMAASLELEDPTVYYLQLSQTGGVSGPLPRGAIQVDWNDRPRLSSEVPLEFHIPAATPLGIEESALEGTRTYAEFLEHGWANQDFLPPAPEEDQLIPGATEMRILGHGKLAFRAGAALLALFLAYLGVRGLQIVRDPAWHTKMGASATAGNTVLQNDIDRFQQWDSFLADRSKAWVTMELVSRLFPDPSKVVVSEVAHTVRPEAARQQTKVSLVKDWTINGYANDTALDQLTTLNTREGIEAAFKAAQEITGDESLAPDTPTRNLVVNLLASENKRYDPDKGPGAANQFPFVFTLTISQRFSAEDPLAIPTAAAP